MSEPYRHPLETEAAQQMEVEASHLFLPFTYERHSWSVHVCDLHFRRFENASHVPPSVVVGDSQCKQEARTLPLIVRVYVCGLSGVISVFEFEMLSLL